MIYELLNEGGEVTGTVVADAEFMAASYVEGAYRVAATQELTPPKPAPRHVTKLAFRNRFTSNEKVAMELAALHDSTKALNDPANLLAATLRASMADQRDARYIDLDRPDTRAGVQALEAAGLLAAGRAAQILDAPVQPHEAYTGEV